MRTFSLCLVVLFASTSAIAQKKEKDAPAPAIAHLAQAYPGVVVKEWKQGSKHWKAEFKVKDEEYDAYYTPEGAWVRTEHNIPKSELPPAVTTALQATKYNTWKIDDVEEHETAEQPRLYKVKLGTETGKAELFFTPEGKLVREEEKGK